MLSSASYLELDIEAPEEFQRALRRGQSERFFGRLLGRPYHLLAFEPVRSKLGLVTAIDRGVKEIPLSQIVGSVGKPEWFTRGLMPLLKNSETRWRAVYNLALGSRGFPPIEVYQVGSRYFILDGHHRASVARFLGFGFIEAHVGEWNYTQRNKGPGLLHLEKA